jgi:hypothetical protein
MKSMVKGKEPHREILVRGESANAGRLISLFEESKLFEQAAPRSPTTKIQPGPGEIFDLGVQLKALPPPQLVQLATAARVETAPAAAPPVPIPPAPPAVAPDPPAPSAVAPEPERPRTAATPGAAAPTKPAETPGDGAPPPAAPPAAREPP